MPFDPTKFYLCAGTVQTYVCRENPWFMQFFGMPEYHRSRPVLSEGRASRAQPIIDLMNDGSITPEEGMERLGKEAYW